MYKKIFLNLVVVLFISSSLSAQQMKCNVALSDDFSLQDKWYNIPSESVPSIRDVKEIYKYQIFYVNLFLGGFQVDSRNIPHVSYSVSKLTPNGEFSILYDSINAISYEVPNANMFLLSNSVLGISFENNALLGEYIISGTITDNLSKEKINFEKKIELIEFIEKEAITNDSLFGEWMQNYFQNPKPEYAISNYLNFLSSMKNTEHESMMNSFFIELFKTNSFLLDNLLSQFNDQSKIIQKEILKVYAYTNYEDSDFLKTLNRKQRKTVNSLQKKQNPYIIEIVNRPEHLDMLWAKFFACGSFEPIQKIVSSFSNSSYLGSLEKLGAVNDTSQINENSWKELVFKAALWSVNSNMKSYTLVRDYCAFIYFDEDTPVSTKKLLAVFLTKEE